MDTETPALTQAAASPRWRRALARPALWLAVLALLAVAAWLLLQQHLGGLQQELERRLSETQAQGKGNEERLQALSGKVALLEARLAETQSQQQALDGMVVELSKGRDERLLAEVEQAVGIAAQQLQLAGNVEAALIALQSADARLGRAGLAQFLPLRKLIARDIDRLKALPLADVPGMALKLEATISSIDALPLASEQRARAPTQTAAASSRPAHWWQQLGREVWEELRGLIRIERLDSGESSLLSPNQAFFLRENLKLRLLDARLALLQRDGKSFREDLRQASAWLERHFDRRARPVQNTLATLGGLAGADLTLQVPSLNETLLALRKFKVVRERDVVAVPRP